MTTEQAPGMPWHDHEWYDATTIGEERRHYICGFGPGCPAEKWEDPPKPPRLCECCGQTVYE